MPPAAPYSLPDLVNGSATPDYRMSDAVSRFFLAFAGTDLTIHEPVGWDGGDWVIKRDPAFHGMNFEFTGDEATLKFHEGKAITFIENVYHTKGPDADLFLTWELSDYTGILALQYLKLSLHTRNRKGDELTISGERVSLHPDIRARWDTTLSMDAKQALVNDPVTGAPVSITPPGPVQLVLHAQNIKQTLQIKPLDKQVDTDWQSFSNSGGSIIQGGNPLTGLTGTTVYRDFYFKLPFTSPVIDEIQTRSDSNLQITTDAPESVGGQILKTLDAGEYSIEVSVDFQADARLQVAGINITAPQIKTFNLDAVMTIAGVEYKIAPTVVERINNRFMGARRIKGTYKVNITLPTATSIYIYGKLAINPNRDNWKGTDVRLLVFSTSLLITAKTTAPASTTPAYPIIEVLRHLTNCLTGRGNIIQSAYYSFASNLQPVDGGGAHRLITNGFLLRGFLNKPLQLSLQDFLSDLQSIDAIGLGYKPTPNGDVIVIEPIANWYRDSEMIALDSYTLIEEQTSADYLHPSVQVGYSKYPSEGPQVLDEFNTQQEYVLPGKSGTVYQAVSGLIASGYAIEQTRRLQFRETPEDSSTYDDDAFIIAVDQTGTLVAGGSSVTVSGSFTYLANKATLQVNTLPAISFLAKGVFIAVSGSAANSGLYKVVDLTTSLVRTVKIVNGLRLPTFIMQQVITLDRTVVSETGTYTISIGKTGTYQAERAEDFARVSGVLDPDTTYNLRLSPRFNLLRHGRYIAGGLVYSSGSESIRCTFTKHNGSLKTQLKSNSAGDLNIDIRRLIGHSDTLYVADLRAPLLPLWKPETIKVEGPLSRSQMLYLRACCQGYHPDSTNHYGYISLSQPGGVDIQGYPLEIDYNDATGKAVLTLLKKFVPLTSTGQRGCSFYSAYTFADFESATPGQIDGFIENCIFDTFQ